MAEEKKRSAASAKKKVEAVEAAPAVTESVKELSLEEKLAAAVGDISRHDADERQRKAELAKSEKRKEEERLARAEEEERIRLERERMSQALKEQKLAAFEYAENYRKKLKRDGEKAKSASKLKAEEEKAAKLAAEREKKAKEIAEAIERERAEAQERAERRERILRAVTMCEVVDENGNVTLVDKSELIAKQKAEAEAMAKEAELKAAEAEAAQAEVNEAPEAEEAEDEAPEAEAAAEEEAPEADDAVPENDAEDETEDGIITVTDDDEFLLTVYADGHSPEDEEAEYRKAVLEYNEAAKKYNEGLAKAGKDGKEAKAAAPVKKPVPPKKAPEAPAAPVEPVVIPDGEDNAVKEAPAEAKKPATVRRVVREPWQSEPIPPATLDDDVVVSIIEEGKEVDDLKLLKKYLKRSDEAVKELYKQIEKTDKALEKDRDRNAAPAAVIAVIKDLGKIIEIRCDNVSVSAAMSDAKRTAQYSSLLAEDIEEYNSRVAAYAILTGEQLTRVSAFLPEHLSAGTGKAVIPVLSYREQYVELKVDENGDVIDGQGDNVTANLVLPPFTAEELVGAACPESKGECKRLAKTVRAALKRLDKAIAENAKQINSYNSLQKKSLEREAAAVEARESAIRHLNARMPRSNRKLGKYEKRLAKINSKYGRLILKERHGRQDAEYERKALRLSVESFVAEREKVHTLGTLLLAVREIAAARDVADTKAALVSELMEYNRASAACGELIGKTLTTLSAAVADGIAGEGKKYPLPVMACRKELVETVGDSTRVIGDRLKSDNHSSDDRPDNSDVFGKDKTVNDIALLREQIMIETLKEYADEAADRRSYKLFRRKAKRTVRKLRLTAKQTDKAIFRAIDEKSVYQGLLENIRVRGKLIEAGAICLSTAVRMHSKRNVNKSQDALYDDIRLYNERAIDFESITGEKFVRISSFLPESMAKGENVHDIPILNYKETYIEALPKTPEAKRGYVDPSSRRAGEYVPLDCRNIRFTDNPILEITVVEPPVTTEGNIEYRAATTYGAARETRFDTFRVLFGLSIALRRVKRRQRRNLKRSKRFDKKLAKLNKRFDTKIFRLESSVPESRRSTDSYRKKYSKLTGKYERALLKLRLKRASFAIERRELKLAVDEFVIHRERLEASTARLYSLRSYGRPGYVNAAKADLLAEIKDYNDRADVFSRLIDTPITHVSANIVEEIVRNGRMFLLPKIVCCREMIETVDEKSRAIGDKYRFGLPVTVNSQGVAVMTGTAYRLDSFGSPDIGIDKDGGPILGAIFNGLRYVGKPDKDAPASKGITYVRNADVEEKEETSSTLETPLLKELSGVNGFLVSAVLTRGKVVGNAKELRMHLRRAKRALKNVRGMVAENRRIVLRAMKDLKHAERDVTGLTGKTGISADIERMKAIALEISENRQALEPMDQRRRMLAATVRAAEELGYMLEDYDRTLSPESYSALEADRKASGEAEIAYAELHGRISAAAEEYVEIFKQTRSLADTDSQRYVLERFERRDRLAPLSERIRAHYAVSNKKLKPKKLLASVGATKPSLTERLVVETLDAKVRRDGLYLELEEALVKAEARIAVRTRELNALEAVLSSLKGRERRRTSRLINKLERSVYDIRVQKKDIEECLAYPTGGFERRLNRINSVIFKAIKKLEGLEKSQRSKQASTRRDIFRALSEARELRTLAAVHELRAISAHAKLVEIRSINLYAASKIEIGRGSRFKCWLRGYGANPKKRAYEELYRDIDRYNECVTAAEDILGEGLTTVSVLMPDLIAERTPADKIPELIYRERFAEVSHRRVANAYSGVYRAPVIKEDGSAATSDGVSVTVPVKIPELERLLDNRALAEKGDYKKYRKSYRRALREIEKGLGRLASDTERVKDEIDDIREDKVHAYDRYQRAVLRIARRTNETVKYQRRMRRRLNLYRKEIYKLECREANSRVLRHLRDGSSSYLTAGGLIIGLDGWVRRLSVQALVYERQRLILACRNLDRIIRASAKLGRNAVADAKREVAEAMASYNRQRDNCADLICEPSIFRADNKLLDFVVAGKLDRAIALVPRIVCSKQLVERREDGENAVSLSTIDPFFKSKRRGERELAAYDRASR